MNAIKSFSRMLVAALVIASAMVVHARTDGPAVPAQVTTVATGGEWTSAQAGGTLRLVIVNQGFEHVHSKLWLEWLALDERGKPRLAARMLVKELSSGFAVVRLDDRRKTFNGLRVQLRAANPYSSDDREVTIEAGKPGQYKMISEAPR
ncbi:hypothetical protein ACSFA7_02685 [Variovorax sp. LT1R20]|uniref:hypothetical protein n=1 Tax=Variovorax sp. LT1R20 TaxID=3443729 RepID=UPI003F48F2C0